MRPFPPRRPGALLGALLALAIPASAHAVAPSSAPSTDFSRVSAFEPTTAAEAGLPTTGFERRGGSSWTTLGEEQTYLGQLDAASPRVSVSEIGRSVSNRPIRLVTVGPPRTQAEIAAGVTALFVCTQHGNEPAGREACLEGARSYAAGTGTQTVLIIPTANPDGVAANTRHNAAGLDINRDHLQLNSPEARAIARVLRDYKPDLVGDMHEYSAAGAGAVEFQSAAQIHPDTDAQVAALTKTLSGTYVGPAVRSAGFVTGNYQPQPQEEIMQVMAGLRHAAGLLVETPRAGTLSATQRVRAQRAAINGLLQMLADQSGNLAAVTADATQRATSEGAAGTQRFFFSPTSYTDAPPCAYRLSDAQFQAKHAVLDLHGVAAVPWGGGWQVSVAQPTQPIIPLLLDARARLEITTGTPVPC